MDINGFEKLSNMRNGPVYLEIQKGVLTKFQTAEHAYQVMKAYHASDFESVKRIYSAVNAWEARRFGREIKGLVQNEIRAYEVMEYILHKTFSQNPKALELLLSTGNEILTHVAPNNINLGRWTIDFPKILMELRSKFQNMKCVKVVLSDSYYIIPRVTIEDIKRVSKEHQILDLIIL
jgi:predicted NAD-dependent protein-ADP-ribosyltransferase YbiA (DUF1768 family)